MKAIEWRDGALWLLDQRRLPHETVWESYHSAEEAADAIRTMKVRGAPAIAATAAYGVALEAARLADANPNKPWERQQLDILKAALKRLAAARPTAVNLMWAVARMRARIETLKTTPAADAAAALLDEAHRIMAEDEVANRSMGRHGAALFGTGTRILTHCNTGSLATAAYGTALGVIRALHEQGKLAHVYVDETRPYLQGARLTAYELGHEGIEHTLITDNMAGYFMQQGLVDAVIVGADRIAANGDTANKIGTYSLAVLCAFHQIPFYVAAPISTFDTATPNGAAIPIEQRSAAEVTNILGQPIAPASTPAAHPAFDVTPHALIRAIITEQGVIAPPNVHTIAAALAHATRREV
ncbi:MAG: S-methyl-5-thioribose-1-phosphate isomerase [Alicyclobacillus sp.]|nr:S-methyl-5-thioribose-1-phosphate isomerase [Alicyclobacillus sp.]